MATGHKHIKQYSRSSFTLEFEVCKLIYPPFYVRSNLRTKKHQKNAIELTKLQCEPKANDVAHQRLPSNCAISL